MADDLITAYCRLLKETNDLTDRLSGAVHDMRIEELDQLLVERERLCRTLAETREQLYQVLQKMDPAEVASLLVHPRELEQEVLMKQAACEMAVSERLRECRSNLAELRRKKTLRHVYEPNTDSGPSRFLDNKT